MGSLMAGWDSPVADPKFINLKRNRSMTKEEIANYWKSKTKMNNEEEEQHHALLKQTQSFSHGDQETEIVKIYKRSTSLPITKDNNSSMETLEEDDEEEESKERLFRKHGWWINSRWAFLNEPPVIASETPFRYAAQFHVAQKHLNSDHHASANGIRT